MQYSKRPHQLDPFPLSPWRGYPNRVAEALDQRPAGGLRGSLASVPTSFGPCWVNWGISQRYPQTAMSVLMYPLTDLRGRTRPDSLGMMQVACRGSRSDRR